jgi:hypothetical protein
MIKVAQEKGIVCRKNCDATWSFARATARTDTRECIKKNNNVFKYSTVEQCATGDETNPNNTNTLLKGVVSMLHGFGYIDASSSDYRLCAYVKAGISTEALYCAAAEGKARGMPLARVLLAAADLASRHDVPRVNGAPQHMANILGKHGAMP